MPAESITKQESTKAKYDKDVLRLIAQFSAATGRDWRLDPLRLVDWVGSLRPTWAGATWRAYRAALLFVLHTEYPDLVDRAVDLLNVASATLPAKPSKVRRMKKLLPEHVAKLVELAGQRRSTNLSLAILLLQGGEILGLRPHEWFGARREGLSAVIENSKHTNGRAFAKTRTVKLTSATEADLALVDHLISLAQAHGSDEGWRARVHAARNMLERAAAQLGIRGLHLYSARHQFSANAKRDGLSRAEIAALMGHASIETAGTHYGRRSAGRRGALKVRPADSDVEAVIALNVDREIRHYPPRPDAPALEPGSPPTAA